MTFSKNALALGIATALLLSIVPASAGAATPEAKLGPELHHRAEGHHGGGRDEKHRLERLRYVANYFDIKTEGKDSKQLFEEIQAAKKANPQKWEAFKAEHRAKFEERLKEAARYFGIATEGKTVEQLHKEVRAARETNPEKWRAFIMEKRAQHDANKGSSSREPAAKEQGTKSEIGRSA